MSKGNRPGNADLLTKLHQARALLDACIAEVPRGSAPKARRSATLAADAKGLPEHILRLRDSGFFKHPQTNSEAHQKLQSVYPCDFNRVAVALLRLQRRKKLRKTSKAVGKLKQVAYVW